jgi:HK97 family phage major capsid protein
MNPEEIRSAIEYLDACLNDITERASADEQEAFDEGIAERGRLLELLERHSRLSDLADVPERQERSDGPQAIRKRDVFDVMEDRSATPSELADAATRAIEPRVDDADNMAHTRSILRRHLTGDDEAGVETWRWARALIGRTHPDYVRGFRKYITGRQEFWTPEERAAMAVGTNTAGGFLVPTHLDPTLILTNNGSSNVIRGISRVVTLTEGNVWNGVTSAGATFSVDGELTEVSDDTPAVARVSVPIFKAQGFIQASIEAFEDVASLSSDVLMLFADGRDVLEGGLHATGSGSGPTGIFTALDANTNVEVTSTTAAAIGLVDLQGMYRSVPVRWRGRSVWVMNPLYLLAIQALGTALSASYSTDITQPLTDRLIGKAVVESDDAPTTQTTTVRDNEIVFGDFSNFLVVDKPGSSSIEFIPHLFNTSNNLPDGRRGWYMHWRTGSDSINDLAFRLLQDKTSA